MLEPLSLRFPTNIGRSSYHDGIGLSFKPLLEFTHLIVHINMSIPLIAMQEAMDYTERAEVAPDNQAEIVEQDEEPSAPQCHRKGGQP